MTTFTRRDRPQEAGLSGSSRTITRNPRTAFAALCVCLGLMTLLAGCFGGDAMNSGLRNEGTTEVVLTPTPPAALTSVTTQADNRNLPVGGTTNVRCVANFADGSTMDVSALASWSSANDRVASITRGVATGVSQGRAVVQANYQGVTAATRLTVGNPPNAKWNFLVYLDGDNDLERFAIENFYQMQAVGSNDEVNVLVLFDRGGYDNSNGGWRGTRLYRVTQSADNAISSEVQVDSPWGRTDDSIEADMSSAQTLTQFIVWCQQNYPADHTALTLWNHGGGVYPRSVQQGTRRKTVRPASRATRGLCWDDTTGTDIWNCLTTDALQGALDSARAQTGSKLDVMNIDACLEQMIELAYQNRAECDYLVGSEENVPGTGNNYTLMLNRLVGNTSIAARDLATGMVDDYQAYYQPYALGVTYSALDMSQMDAFMVAFRAFATELKGIGDNSGADPLAMEAVWQAQFTSDYYGYNEDIDLYDFADRAALGTSANLKTAIDNMVIRNYADDYHAAGSHGVAILAPWTNEQWAMYSPANQYPALAFAQDTDWMPFLVHLAQWGTDWH